MPTYKVVDTRQVQRLTPAGSMKEVYRVWIQTEKGATGAVDVSPDKWNKEALPGLLTEFAAKLDMAYEVASGD